MGDWLGQVEMILHSPLQKRAKSEGGILRGPRVTRQEGSRTGGVDQKIS